MKNLFCFFVLLYTSFFFTTSKAQNCTVNAGIPQTICANATLTLQGQTNGSFPGGSPGITWSQISGPLTTITSPASSSTTVTGISAGTFVYQISTTCLDGSSISDRVTISVKPVVTANAGLDATVCPGTYTLSGNSPSPGTGKWSVVGTNNGVTIVTDVSATSDILLNPLKSGNTTLRWTISQSTSGTTCTSSDDVVITNRGGVSPINAGADTTLNNCYTTTHSMALNGSFAGTNIGGQQGTWSQVSGPNTATFSNVNAANSTASNLIQGTYVFRWTVAGPCVNGYDDVQVTVPAPSASLTTIGSITAQSFCDGRSSTVLTATQPAFAGETGTWSVVSGTGTFSNPASYSTTVSNIGSDSNIYRFTITNDAGCTAYKDAVVNNVAPPSLTLTTASPLTLSCGNSSATVAFTGSGGTGVTQYRVIAAPAGYGLPTSWSNVNAGNTSFTLYNLNYPGTYLVRVMRNGTSDCSSVTQDMTIIVSRTPTASNAGTDQLLACNISATALAGNIPTVGGGTWSQISGPSTAVLADPSQYNTGVSGLVPGAYSFKWIINAGNGCTPSEDVVTVRVANTAPTPANAGLDQTGICHTGPVKLNGNAVALNEVGTWTVSPSAGISFSNVNDPKAVVTGMAANTTYTFTWTIVNGCGSSSDDAIISTNGTQGAGQANAGVDKCLSTTSLTMAATAASPATAVGKWTLVSGPNTPAITNASSPNTIITGLAQGTYAFAWTLNVAGCGAISDTMLATVSPTLTTAAAGNAQTICAANTTLAANTPSVGTGAWTQVSGAGGTSISDPSLANAAVNGLTPGLYKFRWTISSGACSNFNDVLVTVSSLPSAAEVTADSTCLTRTVLNSMTGNTPASGIGTWSQVSGPNVAAITNMSLPNTGLSGLINGNYLFRWTITGGPGCAPSTADMNVSVNMPTAAIGNSNYCNTTAATLTGNANIGGLWSQVNGPSTAGIQNVAPNIGTATGLQPGAYTFQFTPNAVAGCAALTPRTMTLTNSAPATAADAGINQSLCNVTSFSLKANAPTTGTGAWSRVSGPNYPSFSSTSSTTPTVTGAIAGLYTYRWTITNGGCTSADDITITNSAPATVANAGPAQTICSDGGTVSLNANAPAMGTGLWSQVNGPATAAFTNASANTTPVTGLTAPGSYAFKWTIANGACSSNSQTTVQVDAAPTSDAGANETIGGNSYTLKAAQPAIGTGTWSQLAGPASTIADVHAYNTSISGLQLGNSYTYRWTVTNGAVCAAATSDVMLTVSSVLPLNLTSFGGELRNGAAFLLWKVSNEKNVHHYEVERSSNGISFGRVGMVAANKSAAYSYQEGFPAGLSTCYYRLKMVDADGQFGYSSVVRLSTTAAASTIAVVPNPVKGNVVIKTTHNRNEAAVLSVIGGNGQALYHQALVLQAGSQILSLPQTQHLPAGRYQLIITTASGAQLKTVALVVK